MTFSILGHCRSSEQFGIAISSSSPAVAARCSHARPGVGVVASQNVTDPRLGPAVLRLLQTGSTPQAAIDALASEPHIEHRQIVALNATGHAVRSGRHVLGVHAFATGTSCVAAGNMLAQDGVPAAMVAAFEASQAGGARVELGASLLAALQAGLAAGGEAGPVHSAGLLVVATEAWPLTDLRVDWDEVDPIGKLQALWDLWAPQMHDYVRRALDPAAAPGFGVPGAR